MATIRYSAEGTISPERFIAALTDFTDRRPALWPNLDTKFYRLHERGDTWAEVTEGTDVLGGVWARERYVDDQHRPRGRREGHRGTTLGWVRRSGARLTASRRSFALTGFDRKRAPRVTTRSRSRVSAV